MNIAVENKNNKIGFFRIDGRKLKMFIEKVKRDIPDYTDIWSYDYIDRVEDSNIGAYIGIKHHI